MAVASLTLKLSFLVAYKTKVEYRIAKPSVAKICIKNKAADPSGMLDNFCLIMDKIDSRLFGEHCKAELHEPCGICTVRCGITNKIQANQKWPNKNHNFYKKAHFSMSDF